jgi:hypothetical protein
VGVPGNARADGDGLHLKAWQNSSSVLNCGISSARVKKRTRRLFGGEDRPDQRRPGKGAIKDGK